MTRERHVTRSPWARRYMFPGLPWPAPGPRGPLIEWTAEETRWNVRGQPRTRATFGQPHPADFTGGLPIPGDYP